MPLPVLTADDRAKLNRESPQFRKIDLAQRLGDANSLSHAGRVGTGHVRIGTNPNDTDTFTISAGPATVDGVFSPGSTAIYEIDTGAATTAGNVRVVRGASAPLTAVALAAAILATQGAQVSAVVHATDTSVIDIARRAPGGALTLSTSSGGRMLVQNNAEALGKDGAILWAAQRVVTAEDVLRTRVRIQTGLSSIDVYTLRIATSAALNTELAWNGAISVAGGVLELTVGTAAALVAGNIISVFAVGRL